METSRENWKALLLPAGRQRAETRKRENLKNADWVFCIYEAVAPRILEPSDRSSEQRVHPVLLGFYLAESQQWNVPAHRLAKRYTNIFIAA